MTKQIFLYVIIIWMGLLPLSLKAKTISIEELNKEARALYDNDQRIIKKLLLLKKDQALPHALKQAAIKQLNAVCLFSIKAKHKDVDYIFGYKPSKRFINICHCFSQNDSYLTKLRQSFVKYPNPKDEKKRSAYEKGKAIDVMKACIAKYPRKTLEQQQQALSQQINQAVIIGQQSRIENSIKRLKNIQLNMMAYYQSHAHWPKTIDASDYLKDSDAMDIKAVKTDGKGRIILVYNRYLIKDVKANKLVLTPVAQKDSGGFRWVCSKRLSTVKAEWLPKMCR